MCLSVIDLADPANFERLQWGSAQAQFFIGLGLFMAGFGGGLLGYMGNHDPEKATDHECVTNFFGLLGGAIIFIFGLIVTGANLHTFIKIERAPMVYLQDLKK